MGLFDGILICTDLDGTLYKNDKTISCENREAIDYFKSEGGAFSFITGRMPYYSVDAYEAVQPNVPYGCINGGGVYDGAKREYVWFNELSSEALELVRLIDTQFPHVGIQLCCFNKTCFAKENDTTVRFRKTTGLPKVSCDYRDFHEPMGKILFCSDLEDELLAVKRALLESELSEKFDFIRSERSLFEILPKGANKGLALNKLSEYLEIGMAKTVAIGDYDNDASMLKAAGVGIAVSNASEKAKSAADIITVSNEENAIARVIYDIRDRKFGF